MLQLKYNKSRLTTQELYDIEKSIIRNQSTKATQNFMADVNVLHMKTTDLLAHVLSLFIKINAHQILGLTLSQLLDFTVDVAEGYHFFITTKASPSLPNSPPLPPLYHTFYHAADVMTMLHYFCHDLNANEFLTEMDKVCLMVAALCHDIGHPGLNNHYQESMNTELRRKFGKQSTLEAYSAHLAIKLLNKHNVYTSISGNHGGGNSQRHVAITTSPPTTREKFIATIKDLILSTDMMHHTSLESQLHQLSSDIVKQKRKINKQSLQSHSTAAIDLVTTTSTAKKRSFSSAFCLPSMKKRATQQQQQEKEGVHVPANNSSTLDEKSRLSLSRILLHAADISNMTRPWSIAKQWSDLVVQEFYIQGDEEKRNQKTVSPGMDRHNSDQASTSLKFESFIRPFFQALTHVLPKSYILVDYLASNRGLWESLKETERTLKKRKLTLLIHTNRKIFNNKQQHKRSSIVPYSNTTAKNKRTLGYRSHSYPTSLLYSTSALLDKSDLLPNLEFSPPSCLYDNTNTTTTTATSITLYHPYDP